MIFALPLSSEVGSPRYLAFHLAMVCASTGSIVMENPNTLPCISQLSPVLNRSMLYLTAEKRHADWPLNCFSSVVACHLKINRVL